MRTCETCQHWHKNFDPTNLKNPMGLCKRNPPTPTPIRSGSGMGTINSRPSTNKDDTCGEFKPRVNVKLN